MGAVVTKSLLGTAQIFYVAIRKRQCSVSQYDDAWTLGGAFYDEFYGSVSRPEADKPRIRRRKKHVIAIGVLRSE